MIDREPIPNPPNKWYFHPVPNGKETQPCPRITT